MYFTKTPKFIQSLFPHYTWKMPKKDRVIYITFDDGPIPKVTPWVLETLKAYNAKATFFCVGDNIQKHPDVFEQVKSAGHALGNHTYNHLSGWNTENIPYFHNIRKCARLVKSELFRPPYGRIKPTQAQFLARHYNIVMWDVLSGDFDPDLSKEDCLSNSIMSTRRGSIIVFHDSLKSWDKLQFVLPRYLEFFSQKGYRFEAISQEYNAESTLEEELLKRS